MGPDMNWSWCSDAFSLLSTEISLVMELWCEAVTASSRKEGFTSLDRSIPSEIEDAVKKIDV